VPKTSELKGIFFPVTAPVGEPIDATLKTDPWERHIEKQTPEQYVRRRVEVAAYCREDSSIRIHVPATELMREASILRAWLLNGAVALSAADIDVVLSALVDPFNEPVDPLETPEDAVARQAQLQLVRGQLLVVQASRV